MMKKIEKKNVIMCNYWSDMVGLFYAMWLRQSAEGNDSVANLRSY